MRTHTQRGYINRKVRAVLLWHRSLKCWVLTFVGSSTSYYSFVSERAQAVTNLRRDYGLKLPQSGWDSLIMKHKGLTTWQELVAITWSTGVA